MRRRTFLRSSSLAALGVLGTQGTALAIRPGQTKRYRVWEGNTDRHYTSKNGLRAFTIWVPDDQTVVEATWYEEVRGGHRWVQRGRERISGKGRRFSRTVYLRRTENFKLQVKGIRSSRGKRKICYYHVSCIDDPFSAVRVYKSGDFTDLGTWFAADPYQRWHWAGCACWLLVNPADKDIVLFDGYVSKATLGGNHNYTAGKTERKRVLNLVNLLRHFVAQGYKVRGILCSHEHGDHVGDIPYIVGGLQADSDRDFMDTGKALTGRAYKEPLTIVCNSETIADGYFMKRGYGGHYYRLTRSNVSMPVFNGDTRTTGQGFAVGRPYRLGSFRATPYIWDHGKLADGGPGGSGGRRTLAYLVWRDGRRDAARTFFTSGFIEERGFLNSIRSTISCHHTIFAYNEHEITAESAKKIRFLPDSPVGRNYIFTNHMDNNSNPWDMGDSKEEAIDMLGLFLDKSVFQAAPGALTDRVRWMGDERRICLGAFEKRVGVDGGPPARRSPILEVPRRTILRLVPFRRRD